MNPGLYPDMPLAEYLAIKALSSGMCFTILSQCPIEAWIDSPWNPKREQSQGDVADIGTYAHACLLEGGTDKLFAIDPNDYPAKNGNIPVGWGNKSIRAARDLARGEGLLPVLKDNVDAVKAMVDVAMDYIAHSDYAGVFETGASEQTVVWDENGVLCKARPDRLTDNGCIHYKTTKRSVRPETFERVVISSGYDVSLAFYSRGIQRGHHLILAQQQWGSYACKWFGLSNAQSDISARKVERALAIWAACIKAGKFPAYSGEVHYIEPTPWDMAKAEHDMVESEQFSEKELSDGIPL